jgi:hypothetical protein
LADMTSVSSLLGEGIPAMYGPMAVTLGMYSENCQSGVTICNNG